MVQQSLNIAYSDGSSQVLWEDGERVFSHGWRLDDNGNRLAVLLAHLLKWQFQPGLRGNSWRLTIREQRRRIDRLLAQSPSLRPELDGILAEAYGDALLIAERETGLPDSQFPAACPWSFDQALHDALT